MEEEIKAISKGMAKASFFEPKIEQRYASLSHFISMQPREMIKVEEEYLPEGFACKNSKLLYLWLPTPSKNAESQADYVAKARKLLIDLPAECPDFEQIYIDVRNNIGGILVTFINSVLPLLLDLPECYMIGISKDDEVVAKFFIDKAKWTHNMKIGSDSISPLLPVSESQIFTGKKISVFCNRYTMSSGEILCMLFRLLGHKIYGEKTRGLTNGCLQHNFSDAKVMIPFYHLCSGTNICKNEWSIIPDAQISKQQLALTLS
jgi:C-terminal processing protease CtpA/Prc